MRRLAIVAATLAACGSNTAPHPPGPLNQFFYPSGIAVLNHRIVVASSDADLSYDSTTGGSLIAVDPTVTPITVDGAMNLPPFSGEVAIADPSVCPALPAGAGPVAFVPIRGDDLLYPMPLGADGSLACDNCSLKIGDSERGDPFVVATACDTATSPGGPTVARAYVGYLRASLKQAWITQIDLTKKPTDDGYVQHGYYDLGAIHAFAYDETRRRLYFTHGVVSGQNTLDYVDLANGCRIDAAFTAGGCAAGSTAPFPQGLALYGMAFAHQADPTSPVRRAYLSAQIYDAATTAANGGQVGDFGGLLLVVDLSEDATGTVSVDVVDQIPIGYGAGYVRVLPERLPKRDVVAVIAATDGVVWIYDDDTGQRVAFARDPTTGVPITGEGPFALAVDPVPLAGNVARVYVGSFRQHFVTPIDVPLDAPSTASIPLNPSDPTCVAGQPTPCYLRITGGGTP